MKQEPTTDAVDPVLRQDGADAGLPVDTSAEAWPPADPPAVLAAGVVCWRPAGDDLQVLLVHRPRYDDWSFPKGKLNPGELLPQCAVRELAEETGVRAALGRPLPGTRYQLETGQDKQVWYWAGTVLSTGRRTAPRSEVDDVRWVPVTGARDMLDRQADRDVLAALEHAHRAGELATSALVVVRHGVSRPRDSWPRADAERPLVSAGRRQALVLAGLLPCWAPDHVLSSPWRRCVETLGPWAQAEHVKIRTKGGLSESGMRRDPTKAAKHTAKLLARHQPSLLCTHRPVLEPVLATLRTAATPQVARTIPDADPFLAPGEVLVAHVGRRGDGGAVVVAAERHTAPR